jgi:hypothetical protein
MSKDDVTRAIVYLVNMLFDLKEGSDAVLDFFQRWAPPVEEEAVPAISRKARRAIPTLSQALLRFIPGHLHVPSLYVAVLLLSFLDSR